MQRTAVTVDQDTDRFVFIAADPPPETDLYDYPGAYAQRFDGIDVATVDPEPELSLELSPFEAGDYANQFECIPLG